MLLNWDRAARCACILGFLVWAAILTNKFMNFGYYDYDLAIYSQAMWRMIHGSLDVSLFGMNFLGNHAEYISFLVAPVYFFSPHPLTLIFLNVAAFFTAAYLIFMLSRRWLPAYASFILLILYVFYPANIFMLLFEFHFESLGVPLLVLALTAFFERNTRLFLVSLVLLCLVKENMPLVVVMFGVLSLFRKDVDRRVWAVVPILLGTLYFYIVMFHLIPWARSGLPTTGNIYWSLFTHVGPTPQGIIQRMISDPGLVFQNLLVPINKQYLEDLFVPLVYMPVLAPHVLGLAMPLFFQTLFSSAWTNHTIYFHYGATVAPFIFIAFAWGVGIVFKRYGNRYLLLVLVLALGSTSIVLFSKMDKVLARFFLTPDHVAVAMQQMAPRIPDGAGVVASFRALSHFSSRENLYAFYDIWRGQKSLAGYPFPMPDAAAYALIDLRDPWLVDNVNAGIAGIRERIDKTFLNGQWRILDAKGTVCLLQRVHDGSGIRRWKGEAVK